MDVERHLNNLKMKDLVEQYNKLNNSFKKTLVFHVGESAGFFSEYNVMILAMLYCLQHNIRFVLYSKDANFAYKEGWTDYFEPFCKSTSCWLHKYLNVRTFNTGKIRIRDIRILMWQVKTLLYNVIARISKPFVPYLYTQDLWNKFYNKEMLEQEYNFPELEINGDFVHACNKLVELTWRYNPATKREVEAEMKKCDLPEHYISCHIRRGDKDTEYDFVSLNNYVEIIQKYENRDIFVFTDDVNIVKELQGKSYNRKWHTLCEESGKGYFHSVLKATIPDSKRNAFIHLFAQVEICGQSDIFIGTKTSNPSMFLSVYNPKIIKGVDCDGTLWFNYDLKTN